MTIWQLHSFLFITTNYFKTERKLLPQHKYATRNIDNYVAPQSIYNNYRRQERSYLIPHILNKIPDDNKDLTKMSVSKRWSK